MHDKLHQISLPDSPEPGAGKFPPWHPSVAVAVVFATFLFAQLAGLVVWLYPLAKGWNESRTTAWLENSTVAQFAYIAIVEAVTVLLLYLFIRSYKVSFRSLGLVRPRLKDAGAALLAAPVYILSFGVLLAVLTRLFPGIDVNQEQQIGFSSVSGGLELLLTFISLAVLPPIVEELTTRGFLFTSLRRGMSFVVAALVTSGIFAAAHLQFGSGAPLLWVAAVDTFILSVILCYMREKTGSLWPCIFLHGLKNSIAFVLLFLLPLWGIELG